MSIKLEFPLALLVLKTDDMELSACCLWRKREGIALHSVASRLAITMGPAWKILVEFSMKEIEQRLCAFNSAFRHHHINDLGGYLAWMMSCWQGEGRHCCLCANAGSLFASESGFMLAHMHTATLWKYAGIGELAVQGLVIRCIFVCTLTWTLGWLFFHSKDTNCLLEK